MAIAPTEEKKTYDAATDMVETPETVLPASTIGMQARKRALREGRVTPAWRAAEIEAAAAEDEAAQAAEEEAKAGADGYRPLSYRLDDTAPDGVSPDMWEASTVRAPDGAVTFCVYEEPAAGHVGWWEDKDGACVGFLTEELETRIHEPDGEDQPADEGDNLA